MEGSELNIAFQFVILILQNFIQRKKLVITVFRIFSQYWEQKVIIFVDVLLEKNAHAHPGYRTRNLRKT